MERILGQRQRVLVRQVKEWGEILLGFESRNRYDLLDEDGSVIGHAAEEGGGLGRILLRNFLGTCRAATFHFYDKDGQEVGHGVKPFRFYFHRLEVFDSATKLGAVQRKWAWFSRKFVLEDENGNEMLQIVSPFFRIWTFKLLLDGQEVGRIAKKWGGVLREMFTDADTFGVEFGHPKLPLALKKMLLAAVFLVDMTCFENNQGRGGTLLDAASS